METTFFRAGRTRVRFIGSALQRAARVIVVLSLIFAFEVAFPDGNRDRPTADAAVPQATRLFSLGTQTLVNLSDPSAGNIRGITSDGTKVYIWRSVDHTKIWEVPLSSITANQGGSRTVTPTSWSIINAPSANVTTQLVYSSGCLFLFTTSGALQCIDLATRTASTVSAPAGYSFPAGKGWVTGSLIGFPDGRIGKVGQPIGTNTTVRVYSVSGTGGSVTLSFDRDLTLVDTVSTWPADDHGSATDGVYLYRTNYSTGGYKVWQIQNTGNSSIIFNGDGSGACSSTSGTFCNYNPSVGGVPILSNGTFLGRDHVGGRLLVGDYDGARFYMTESANPAHTVTYDSQGGSAVSSGSTVTNGSIAASPGTPTRAGYTFAGWFAASSGGSAITFPYAHGQTSNFTLFAQWTANPLTVTYDSQGGSAVSSGSTVTGGSIAASPGTPTRDSHVFKGWFAASSGGSAITFPYAHGRTANFTLFAQWLAPQTGFTITGAPASLAYNSTVTLGTTGGNGSGAVVFATTSPGVCSVHSNSGLVTMLASTGTCSIAATKAGDSSYDSTSASVNISASKATQSALAITGTSSGAYGATLSLSTTGGTTAGTVTWSDGSSTACTVNSTGSVSITAGTGTCTITATMAGNSNYLPVESAGFTVTVSRATQSTLTVTSTSAAYGQDLTLTTSGGSGTGSVTWAVVSGTSSTCTITGATLTPGDAGSACVVRATKAQDANWSSRQSANTTVTVDRANQTGFSITSAASFTTGSPLALTATGGQSTGSVTWLLQSGTCTLSGASLTASRGGITCSVQATRAGDTNWYPVSDTQTVTVNKITQSISFRSTPPSPANVGATYTVTVDSTAFLAATIVIANQSSSVCSISAGVVSFAAAGVCVISASQGGNDTYSSAVASQSVTVVALAAAATTTTTQPSTAVATPVSPEATAPTSATTPAVTSTTTTVPATKKSARGATTTTTSSTTTTTTTTTTIPADPTSPQAGADGLPPDLDAGEVTAMVRGQSVKVKVERLEQAVVLTLPNDVRITIGRTAPGGDTVAVAADGVLRIYRDELADVAANGLIPGTTYTVYMFSDPVELGRGEANSAGAVKTSVQVPKDAPYGGHTLQFNGVGPGGEMVSTSVGFEVLERQNNTALVVFALGLGVLLALLGGRPIFSRRRRGSAPSASK